MSSRSLAAARSRRSGENAPPVSGNRPITSIGSQAAFAQQMPPHMSYNMPPPPNNVRVARANQPPATSNNLPFQKLSVSDAIGLITLRLGRVEQWVIETDHEHEEETNQYRGGNNDVPNNHKIIDSSVLTSIINRLDSLEKNGSVTGPEDTKELNEQFKRMGDVVSKHTIELAKNTEQVFRFNRELIETKDLLKSFMIKYDMFAQETTQNFTDYEIALSDLEKRLPAIEEQVNQPDTNINDIDVDADADADADNNVIMSAELKNMIKQEVSNT
jgi:hypothetical protein